MTGVSELERTIRYLYQEVHDKGQSLGLTASYAAAASVSTVRYTTINFVANLSGIAANGSAGYVVIDFPATVTQVTLIGDTVGSANVEILKCQAIQIPGTVSMTGGNPMLINNQQVVFVTDFTTWNNVIAAGDVLEYRITGASGLAQITIGLKVAV